MGGKEKEAGIESGSDAPSARRTNDAPLADAEPGDGDVHGELEQVQLSCHAWPVDAVPSRL